MGKISKTKNTEAKQRQPLTKNVRLKIILVSVLIFLFGVYALILISNFTVKTTRHSADSDKINEPLRLALISDLHQKSAFDFEEQVSEKIKKENPDLIFMVGDFLSRDDADDNDYKTLDSLIRSLKQVAPVYFSLGNHEKNNSQIEHICQTVTYAGAILLDNEYTDITVNYNKLRIGGISYYRYWDENANSFLTDFCAVSDDVYTLLMSHHPEFYLWGTKDYPIDLTLSGHTHGGMLKIPLIGPLYSPEQGWLPDYAAGFYEFENGYLAVTTGLGSSPEYLPRVFNRPEIMIIDLK